MKNWKYRPLSQKKFCYFSGALLLSFVSVSFFATPAKSEGWFVPKAAKSDKPEPKTIPVPTGAPAAAPAPPPAAGMPDGGGMDEQMGAQTPPILPLPNVPVPPPIGKEAPPPGATIGVINIPGVMALSTAAREIQQELGARRDKLARIVQDEERAWQGEVQQLQAQAHSLPPDQLQAHEKRLQERRIKDQREFGGKARIIQEAYQVAFHQLERELEQRNGIIGQVAEAHNMNLVLRSEQTVLHVDEQDITKEVADRLNKVLSHVYIPAADEDPELLAKSGKMPTTADEERLMNQAPPPEEKSPPSVLRN
ncbi:OmpH family outer membrane protein [Acetobacteraceae bacterium]|nr:OmpH family outer membrane protein [Acetobacteraceae bacterium]